MNSSLARPVLVLDSGYQAVNVVPMRRALALIATGKAVAVEEDPRALYRSEQRSWRGPTIIRLFIAIAYRVYRSFRVKFNKHNILARDDFRCQYCGASEVPLTIDHVVPKSRRTNEHPKGGATSWDNCVAACLPCNAAKGNRTPAEAGLHLRKRPARPRWFLPVAHRRRRHPLDPGWRKYLP